MRVPRLVVAAAVLALAGLAAAVAVLAAGEDDATPAPAAATAPIAPEGVTLLPSCASDAPTEGLEATEDRTVKLPSPPPERFDPDSPERALAEFMDAWRDRAFDRMATWTTPSWRRLAPEGADHGALLRRRYANFRLLGWTIVREERGSGPAVRRFRVLVAYRDVAPRAQRERLLMVLDREDDEGRLVRAGGRWGVFLAASPDAQPGCTAGERSDA